MGVPTQLKLSQFVWDTRYRDRDAQPPESTIEDTWNRVATTVAAIESDPPLWGQRFLDILHGYRFLIDRLVCDILIVKPANFVSRVPRGRRGARLAALAPELVSY